MWILNFFLTFLYFFEKVSKTRKKDQIVKLFSDRDSMVSFDDFLDMMIVMHPKTKRHIKLAYMFAIYDFDNDGVLNHADLMHVIHRITGGALRGLLTEVYALDFREFLE